MKAKPHLQLLPAVCGQRLAAGHWNQHTPNKVKHTENVGKHGENRGHKWLEFVARILQVKMLTFVSFHASAFVLSCLKLRGKKERYYKWWNTEIKQDKRKRKGNQEK